MTRPSSGADAPGAPHLPPASRNGADPAPEPDADAADNAASDDAAPNQQAPAESHDHSHSHGHGHGHDHDSLLPPLPPLLPPLSKSTRRRIAEFDRRVDEALDRLRGNPVADRVFYSASALGDHSLVWLMLGALRGLRSEHDWKAAVRVGLMLGAESALVNVGIKSLFRRTRPPWQDSGPLRLRKPLTSSFPSGHATSAFTAAGLLADDDPLWPAYYALAVLVAASRVYVRVHHASDVMGGVPIGVGLGRIGRRLLPLPPRPTGLVG